MTNPNSKYAVYALRGLHPGIFGETYAIATGTEIAPARFIAEYFILTQRPSEDLQTDKIEIGGKVPPELGSIDVNFALEEAYQKAEIALSLMLEKRARQLGHQELAFVPFELRLRSGALMSTWMRDRFTQQLVSIGGSTKCPSLALYLDLLQQNVIPATVSHR